MITLTKKKTPIFIPLLIVLLIMVFLGHNR